MDEGVQHNKQSIIPIRSISNLLSVVGNTSFDNKQTANKSLIEANKAQVKKLNSPSQFNQKGVNNSQVFEKKKT